MKDTMAMRLMSEREPILSDLQRADMARDELRTASKVSKNEGTGYPFFSKEKSIELGFSFNRETGISNTNTSSNIETKLE